ncbi:hypothetical protein RUESEDTHA_03702 [Ruegeria sp. THAF57]|uniref:CsoS2 family carboxysome shell protein n=1 Tax=Ruegeria sp. THAF57 TaxID=2744555 RepID=UPI0015DEF418|nr:CsoS2 family carboxysome shell protein [Ruegeria sp. THAF57]CAD0186791.1 hypothetical protein RUESEDTHA_03702 [Ruegeria sp. THAF57]
MSTDATKTGLSGREASMARRKALSHGKTALPTATERVRSGFREGAMPKDNSIGVNDVVPSTPLTPAPVAEPVTRVDTGSATGRQASMARRKALSQGKGALPAATERVRSGFRQAAMPETTTQAAPAQTGREAAIQHRKNRVEFGQGNAPDASQTERKGSISHPPKVPSVNAAGTNAPVTGLSYSTGQMMTGAEAGHDKPLTGTQYVAGDEGGYRAAPEKVGHALTSNGQTVSGTMLRSSVQITGDEERGANVVTGNADQTLGDMVNHRPENPMPVAAQFPRQAEPHGQTVHGTNLGRATHRVGARGFAGDHVVEQTLGGHAVSGTVIGRSVRVTGDETGSDRPLTGSQYAAPSAFPDSEQGRIDPASGGKVCQSHTWTGQTVTGPQLNHDPRVTGSEHGTCATMTGTPYFSADSAQEWCDPEQAQAQAAAQQQTPPRAITGDVPLNDPMVSGTGRGADRDITGSRYFVAADADAPADTEDQVAGSINGFSVRSPQRAAHLQTRAATERDTTSITGTFAQGQGKITGNVEFSAPVRAAQNAAAPAHRAVTGEGSVKGSVITGSAWREDSRVTGTEDSWATLRNPTERSGSARAFAGAVQFGAKAVKQDQSSSVTGAVGWTPKSGAVVTLSGGAAG